MPRTLSTRSSTRSSTRLPRSASAAGQLGISSFARTTKPGSGLPASKILEDGKSQVQSGGLPVSPSKKRKLHELANVECIVSREGKNESIAEEADLNLTPSKVLKFSNLSVNSPSPRKGRSGHYVSTTATSAPSPSSSPSTRSTAPSTRVSSQHGIEEPSTPSKRQTSNSKDTAKTTKKTPSSTPFVLSVTRAPVVEELVRLHSAFLKALTIHVAHRGLAAPADLREFLPSIERIWKKRKVVVKDLQRLLWIHGKDSSPVVFRLANHGLGRVCLERIEGRMERVDEAELQSRFEGTVDLLWEEAVDKVGGEEEKVDFLAGLGLAQIQESLAPFTSFRKGQQRLQDLKGGVIRMKMEGLAAESVQEKDVNSATSPSKMRSATTSRKLGLLERIKSKVSLQAKLPPPPSKDVLMRRAAAGRVEEVAGVLSLLRPAGYVGSGPMARMAVQRTPFCLETIVRNVQDSTRNPISEKEVEACLEILAREDVAGHWISIVVVNQLKSVVLKSCGDVQLKDVALKVSQLKAGWEDSS
ncbi:hypothetical protein BJY04DRAFT_215112 [Aspergillus karnatakaensis]|uniref:DNA replication factor Cdt1 C-terminal domain-containing protein n=1 Tax=Aspergillus karnatakaensis TaxID=1810916 RepID=UPI003CCDF898